MKEEEKVITLALHRLKLLLACSVRDTAMSRLILYTVINGKDGFLKLESIWEDNRLDY